jgi:alkylation response protein AidB-like acyl-CoA dehydrogenase
LLSGNEARQGEVFSKILEGGTATLAFTATGKRGLEGITATFRKEQGKRVLNGNYRFVVDGHSADTLILSAREEGAPQNIALFRSACDNNGNLPQLGAYHGSDPQAGRYQPARM